MAGRVPGAMIQTRIQQAPATPSLAGRDPSRSKGRDGAALPTHLQAPAKVLVCLDERDPFEGLIRAGARLAASLDTSWAVAFLQTTRTSATSGSHQHPRTADVLKLAESLGAEIVTLSGPRLDRQLADLARRLGAGHVVHGRPTGPLWQRWQRWPAQAILRTLLRQSPGLDIVSIATAQGRPPRSATAPDGDPPPRAEKDARRRALDTPLACLWGVGLVAAITLGLCLWDRPPPPAVPLLVFLIGVVLLAARFGFWPAAVAAVSAVLSADYLLFAPYDSFAVARSEDVVTLVVFLVAALAASRVTDNLRFEAERARQRELRVRFLYELTKALSAAQTPEEVAERAAARISDHLAVQARIRTDATAPEDTGHCLTISSHGQPFGLLALNPPAEVARLPPEQLQLLDTVTAQIGLALERIHFAKAARAATLQVETETLRNSLLSAIAHDFRTPLASIVAGASALLDGRAQLSEQQRQDLLRTILEEGQRMTRLANNTLDMARIESGSVTMRREWYPVEETVGAVITRMRDRLQAHVVETRLPSGVAMAQVDEVMVVQVL